MKSYRKELWFNVPGRRAFINITPQVQECLRESGIQEGLCLDSARLTTIPASLPWSGPPYLNRSSCHQIDPAQRVSPSFRSESVYILICLMDCASLTGKPTPSI